MSGKTGGRRTKAQLTDAQIRSMAEFPEENPNPVLRVTEDGRVLYANRPAQALLDAFGWRTGQPLPQPLPDAVRRVLDGVGSEIDLTDPHERVWSFALAVGARERHVNLYARDVTGRKHAEEALRKSHEELEQRVRERTAELVGVNKELGAEIAERIKAEETAKAERQRLNDLLEILPVYVVLLTPEYHVPFANRFFRERFGESHGKRCFEYLFGRTEPCEACETYTVMKTHAPHHSEWTGPDGRNYDIFDFPFPDTDGSTLIMEMGIDSTERKQVEEALRRSTDRFKLLSEITAQLLVSENPQAIVERLCREVMEHLDCDCFFNFLADEASGRLRLNAFAGIPPEEARKIEWLDYGVGVCGCVARQGCWIVAEDIQHTDDPRTELVKSFGIQAYACHPLLGQGRVIGTLSFGARSRTTFTGDELALMKTVADQVAVAMQRIQSQQALRRAHDELDQRVAERTLELLKVNEELTEEIEEHGRLLEALRKSEARLAEAQRIAHLGGWDWNVATGELSWSDEMFRIFGFAPQSFAVNYSRFLERVHPDDRANVDESVKRRLEGLERYDVTYRIVLPDDTLRVVHAQGEVEFNEAGAPVRMIGTVLDITEQVRAQEEATIRQQQLVQADKMVSIGILASGIAHEINNPNHSIMSNVSSLAAVWHSVQPILDRFSEDFGDFVLGGFDYFESRDKLPRMFANALASSKRIELIVTELRDFARYSPSEKMTAVDVNAVVKSAVILVTNMVQKHTDHFTVDYGTDLPAVIGNSQRIEQVVINLIHNACQSLPNRAKGVHVRTSFSAQAQTVQIEVRDEGVGIPEEDLRHLGDPFFTSKRAIGGMGLGLWISFNIAHEHGGTLTFSSKPGEGASAVLAIPSADLPDGRNNLEVKREDNGQAATPQSPE